MTIGSTALGTNRSANPIAPLSTTPSRRYYSQTYRPGHHNFTEEFIFEPRLEPGLPASTLAELNAANIQFLYVDLGFVTPVIYLVGLDQKMRRL